jgi:sugar lactone lactonase YvrE
MGGAVQGTPLSLTTAVTTVAGKTQSRDGIGAAAGFAWPSDVTSDGTNLYVADSNNNSIRKIVIATGAVTTLAGKAGVQGSSDGTGAAASFYLPEGIVTDGTNLYVSDSLNNTIRKIVIATGVVTTLAGSPGRQGSSDGIGATARFNWPRGLACDGSNLYVVDGGNYTVRKIVIATGVVTTLAGSPGQQGTSDGVGSSARFRWPECITIVGQDLYVADTNAGIRKIEMATGAVTTIAGTPTSCHMAMGITSDGTNLYVTDSGVYGTIKKVAIATGTVTTIAGNTGSFGSTDSFYWPGGITVVGSSLYVADSDNNEIKKIVIATGDVTILAGTTDTRGSADGPGIAASFSSPHDITTDGTSLFVTDKGNNTIRKIDIATWTTATLAGSVGMPGSTDGTGAAARFDGPNGITTDGTNLYVTDLNNNTIREIGIVTGAVTTLAGSAGTSGAADGTGTAASFNRPLGITTDGTNLYVTDSGNNTIRKIVIATGAVTTLAGTAGTMGSSDGTGAAARFYFPTGITTDGLNLYVVDYGTQGIRKVDIVSGRVSTMTGTAGHFYSQSAITTDGTSLFVTETMNSTVSRVTIATGITTTLAGSVYGYQDGIGVGAKFYNPTGIITDGTRLFVADSYNNLIRKIE